MIYFLLSPKGCGFDFGSAIFKYDYFPGHFHCNCLSVSGAEHYWWKHTVTFTYAFSMNTLWSRQNGRRFADDTFKRMLLNENVRISIKISLKFVPKGPVNNNPSLVQIMAWRRSGAKPLSEPMLVSLATHICVTRPQGVKYTKSQHRTYLFDLQLLLLIRIGAASMKTKI